ncbi:hypothetical protein [Pyxidicoccus xibeiensis]|uniref:hypothetical protein n=1 Tax=Pyxidicoccus xibeiensis TaxID=2906759 RepID=UPI0020A81BFB|nr:hypothetical protein [Pyxidicoccus xibeiensis]MCP3135756.1 hypothetical protein [Pyxidicoccus xibeiensis]
MSDSSRGATHPLIIEGSLGDSWVEVFDGRGDLRWSGSEPQTLHLPRGVYQVRASLGSRVRDTLVRHEGETRLPIEPPPYTSSAPLHGNADAPDECRAAAVQWSGSTTGDAPGASAIPDLFIFVWRKGARASVNGRLGGDVTLQSPDGRLLRLDDPTLTRTDGRRWVAFSTATPAAAYRLSVGTTEQRTMPVQVFRGWCTQVFLAVDEEPELERATVFLAPRGKAFDPSDETARAVDLGLSSLREAGEIPHRVRDVLLSEKFENPLLGLVGAHLTLSFERERPIDGAIQHLRELIGDCPDVRALEVRAALKFQRVPREGPPLREFPMLRRGFDALQQWATINEDLLHDDLLDLASHVRRDSPWTTWETKEVMASLALSLQSPQEALPKTGLTNWVDMAVLEAEASGEGTTRDLAVQLGVSRKVIQHSRLKVAETMRAFNVTARALFQGLVTPERRTSPKEQPRSRPRQVTLTTQDRRLSAPVPRLGRQLQKELHTLRTRALLYSRTADKPEVRQEMLRLESYVWATLTDDAVLRRAEALMQEWSVPWTEPYSSTAHEIEEMLGAWVVAKRQVVATLRPFAKALGEHPPLPLEQAQGIVMRALANHRHSVESTLDWSRHPKKRLRVSSVSLASSAVGALSAMSAALWSIDRSGTVYRAASASLRDISGLLGGPRTLTEE